MNAKYPQQGNHVAVSICQKVAVIDFENLNTYLK